MDHRTFYAIAYPIAAPLVLATLRAVGIAGRVIVRRCMREGWLKRLLLSEVMYP